MQWLFSIKRNIDNISQTYIPMLNLSQALFFLCYMIFSLFKGCLFNIGLYGCQNRQDLPSVCAAIQEPFMQHVMYMCTIKFPHWDKVTCCIDWIFHILCSVQEYAVYCTD